VGRALSRVRTAFLDGEVESRDEALALAAELARRQPKRKPRGAKAGPTRRRRRRRGSDADDSDD
jgi:hypothetical protein